MNLIRAKSQITPAIALALAFLWLLCPAGAIAQGSIFGAVTNSNLSVPANGDIEFFGFLRDTDEEIRLESSTGAGFQNGNWFDDFQNYLTEAPNEPYDYFFFNSANGENAHLAALMPDNSFQQEDVLLSTAALPAVPTQLQATAGVGGGVVLSWQGDIALTYHVYRRDGSSFGSFFRIDDPSGSLANRGVSGSAHTDLGADTALTYAYVLIAEDDAGSYSAHSAVVVFNPGASSCCIGIRGNVNAGSDDVIDIADVVYLVAYMFKGGDPPPCLEEANINGGADGVIDIADLVQLVAFAFKGGAAPPACP